jgi:hypothetical protein
MTPIGEQTVKDGYYVLSYARRWEPVGTSAGILTIDCRRVDAAIAVKTLCKMVCNLKAAYSVVLRDSPPLLSSPRKWSLRKLSRKRRRKRRRKLSPSKAAKPKQKCLAPISELGILAASTRLRELGAQFGGKHRLAAGV